LLYYFLNDLLALIDDERNEKILSFLDSMHDYKTGGILILLSIFRYIFPVLGIIVSIFIFVFLKSFYSLSLDLYEWILLLIDVIAFLSVFLLGFIILKSHYYNKHTKK